MGAKTKVLRLQFCSVYVIKCMIKITLLKHNDLKCILKKKTFNLTLLESALFESTDCKCFNKYMNVYLYL